MPLAEDDSKVAPSERQERVQAYASRALAMLRKQFPECRLLVAGDGPSRESLKQLTRKLGVESTVQFAGFVEDVGQVYAALDVFAFPSREEGLGSALLGAMACGLPVVATASGGVPEIVDERNGLLVTGFRVERFAAALARLLSDADLVKAHFRGVIPGRVPKDLW